jgi:small subunit ribosomal protein S20
LVSNPPTGEAGKETKQALPTGRQAQELLSQAYKAIDKAAKTGILKKNAAARKKSRLARLLASTRS